GTLLQRIRQLARGRAGDPRRPRQLLAPLPPGDRAMRARSALALVLGVAFAMPSAAAVVCRNKGRVFVRDECKKREKLVPLDLRNGPPGDGGAAWPTTVRVVDAAG